MGIFKFSLRMLNIISEECLFYFISVVISIAIIFNTFNLLTSSSFASINNMPSTIQGATVRLAVTIIPFALLFVLSVFSFYANSVFVQNKSKEMAIASLFGISRNKLAIYLLFQNFLIEVFGTLAGIVLGYILQPLCLTYMYKGLGTTGNIWAFSLPSLVATSILIILQLMYATFGDFVFISTKEIKELMYKDREIRVFSSNPVQFPTTMFLIIYFFPLIYLLLGPSQPAPTQFISFDGMGAFWGTFGIIKYVIPKYIVKLKKKRYLGDKITLVSISNASYFFKEMGFLMCMLVFMLRTIIDNLALNYDSKYAQIISIFSFFCLAVIFSFTTLYKVLIELKNKTNKYKQLVIIGYTLEEIKKVVSKECFYIFSVIIILPFFNLVILFINLSIDKVLPASLLIILATGYLAVSVIFAFVTYFIYKKKAYSSIINNTSIYLPLKILQFT